MLENQSQIQNRFFQLEEQRRKAERAIVKAAVTIQRHTRGFITRIKVKQVQIFAAEFERARLNEMLGSMQASVKDFAAHTNRFTPGKMMSPIKEFATAEKGSQQHLTNQKQVESSQ